MKFLTAIKDEYFVYFLPLLILAINLLIFNRFFMPIEGWWTTFGYLINQGLSPYEDFSTAIVPLFMYFNAFLLNIFGDSFINFRILGVFTVILTYLLLQWLLSKLTDKKIAAIATFSAFSLNMSTPVYLAYDYTSYIDLLTIIIFIIYYVLYKSNNLYKTIFYSFALGLGFSMMLLLKQNIGIFFGLALCISLIIFIKKYKLVCYISVFIGFTILLLEFNKVINLVNIIQELILKNDAKGSISTVLFRFVTDIYNIKILLFAIMINILFEFYMKYEIQIINLILSTQFYKKLNVNSKIVINAIYSLILLLVILIFLHMDPFYTGFFLLIKIIIIAILLNMIYSKLIKKDDKLLGNFKYFLFLLLSLVYTTTQSAGYNFIGLYFVVAFTLAYLFFKMKELRSIQYLFILFIIIMVSMAFSKVFEPYNWWGLTQNNILKAKYSTDYRQLNSIKVDKKTKDLFNIVKTNVDKYSKERNDTLFYPDLPIFYFLHHKLPPEKLVVQWFDFATSTQLEKDLIQLKQNPPKLLVILQPPLFVYKGHYHLLHHYLSQIQYDNYFDELLLTGKYDLVVNQYFLDEDDINPFNRVTRKIVVVKKDIIGKSISNLTALIPEISPGNFMITKIVRNGYSIQFDKINQEEFESIKLRRGDIMYINMSSTLLNNIIKQIGYVLDEEDYYILKILVRNDH